MNAPQARGGNAFIKQWNPAAWADHGRRIIPIVRAYGGIRPRAARVAEPRSLGRIGSLEVRLAANATEVRRAQRLRFHVFYEEMRAIADGPSRLARRDIDAFDAICDHLVVVDHDLIERPRFGPPRPAIVGTYRLLRQEIADRHGGFYTASEFDISGLLARHKGRRFLELGRSCVLPAYRTKRTVELLWQGIWSYVLTHRIDVMFGCASLEGTDPKALSMELSFLSHCAKAPAEWAAGPLPARHVPMDRLSKDAIDMKRTLHVLPPLIKGYLRLGAYIGNGAVVDHQFGTTDVLVVLPVEAIHPRYVEHFGGGAERQAA
ncbi:GNAT family N-acetyltransferase [Phreatobacter aquaticus]|uniref:L-ornithine N(alpha)-acyltransferase n=1 Tax=Phreatobacter aquaticus TaxID=2570229 RepID=A0A4D7QK72_9HYPH|nr:GNAT family N-acyltransferase [Phreatobacter aquaticus]QCK86373.1 GNAT family N-acetyltransferase [Phreatobacter aquaticus]